MENGEYKLDVESRITRVETYVDEIRLNHLPHIEQKIDKVTWLLLTLLVGIVINLAVQLVK